MRVGVLTGGGDAPGLNPAIKGLVYRGSELGLEIIGLFDGWRSLMNPAPDVLPLDRETVRRWDRDRKSTRLNSSHGYISYAVFCLKKKKNKKKNSNMYMTKE